MTCSCDYDLLLSDMGTISCPSTFKIPAQVSLAPSPSKQVWTQKLSRRRNTTHKLSTSQSRTHMLSRSPITLTALLRSIRML